MTDKPLDIGAIEARCEAATKGPWYQDNEDDDLFMSLWGIWANGGHTIVCAMEHPNVSTQGPGPDYAFSGEDCDFIAHAREDVPALIAEVKRLRAENEAKDAEIERLKEQFDGVLASVDAEPTFRCGTVQGRGAMAFCEGQDWVNVNNIKARILAAKGES